MQFHHWLLLQLVKWLTLLYQWATQSWFRLRHPVKFTTHGTYALLTYPFEGRLYQLYLPYSRAAAQRHTNKVVTIKGKTIDHPRGVKWLTTASAVDGITVHDLDENTATHYTEEETIEY